MIITSKDGAVLNQGRNREALEDAPAGKKREEDG
jgi:hypothetical protein